MSDPRIPLKRPGLAGVLAFLIPGLGHWYQGRFFKATIYSVCILGMFYGGLALGDWQPVYYKMEENHSRFGYFSQAMVGLPALSALVQKARFDRDSETGVIRQGDLHGASLEAEPFTGALFRNGKQDVVSGKVSLEAPNNRLVGTFEGSTEDGQQVALDLSGSLELQQAVYPSNRRGLNCKFVSEDGPVELSGAIPRSFLDWYQVPLGDRELADAHGRLGKRYDLACVLTWIAGLLNILAIWDAVEGPAYGYGDEDESNGETSAGQAVAPTKAAATKSVTSADEKSPLDEKKSAKREPAPEPEPATEQETPAAEKSDD